MSFSTAWIAWIVLFFVIEIPAIYFQRTHRGTLSQHVWRFIENSRWRRFLFLSFWAWLTVHFFTRGWV